MKFRSIALMGAVAAISSACALFNRPAVEPDPVPSFGYGTAGDQNSGVVQAFNLAGSTYVQFLDLDRARPVFVDEGGKPLEYKVSGQYAVLNGHVSTVTVATNFGRVVIYRLGSTADPQQMRPAAPVLAAAAASPVASAPAPVAPRPSPEMMTATFTFGPDQWSLSTLNADQRRELKATIEVLKLYPDHQVRIVGYADPSGGLKYNLRLSEKRADELAKAFRDAGFTRVLAFGRGPRDQVSDCSKMTNKVLLDRCLAASRRVVIDLVL